MMSSTLGDTDEGEVGAATAEYAIATMAAVGFAGLLVVIMRSDEVRQILTDLVRSALTFTGRERSHHRRDDDDLARCGDGLWHLGGGAAGRPNPIPSSGHSER
ncbi:MAG: DUF4244 domain-containing protein [Microbacteriaceae bacterium]|nr:DUF4244 domain-containing protein [Microbacteriaceae bacterium]